jgi:TolB-like protein
MKLRNQIGRSITIYLGSAWVIMEASNFFIDRYHLEPLLLDILIILLVFGAFMTLVFNAFTGRWNKKAIIFQFIIVLLALSSVVTFSFNPSLFNPSKLRVLPLSKKENPFEGLHAIAVLPFSNFMGDDSQEYLLAGMHDGLISEIGKLGNLRVISRTSSLPYKDSKKNIQEIAKELGVDAIIETSLTRVDTLVELKMKLIEVAPTESVVWDHSYSLHTNELPNLFREVTKNIAQKIEEVALPESEKLLAPQRVPNPGAYEATLRGHYYMGLLTKEGFELAEQQYKRAIEIDSLYALGYAGLSGIIASQRQMGFVHGDHIIQKLDSIMQIAT